MRKIRDADVRSIRSAELPEIRIADVRNIGRGYVLKIGNSKLRQFGTMEGKDLRIVKAAHRNIRTAYKWLTARGILGNVPD